MKRKSELILLLFLTALVLALSGCRESARNPNEPNGLDQEVRESADSRDDADAAPGRIVVGDSRCCQLGAYEEMAGRTDFVTFAVWGGHYASDVPPFIITDETMTEIERCFEEQIEECGGCTVFFFATINDYDYTGNFNEGLIGAALEKAESIASMKTEIDGKTYCPKLVVIGFEGCREGDVLFGDVTSERFNLCVDDYNKKLEAAVNASEILERADVSFTTVREIVKGGVTFVDDGVHYGEETIREIAAHIASYH